MFSSVVTNVFGKKNSDIKRRLVVLLSLLIIGVIIAFLGSIVFSRSYPFLLGLVFLSFGFGLRHAVDADHIAAIDNTTRKLMQDGQKPVAVGFFFSLGHSTIVVLLSSILIFSTPFINNHISFLHTFGPLIGTTISSLFLLFIGILNLIIFIDLLKIWQHIVKGGHVCDHHVNEHLHKRGLLARLLRPVLAAVSNSWNMYFVGFLFGLGFDTASEIALLSLSAITASKNIPPFVILLLPFAFTVGMAIIDTLDGVLMLGAYGWAYIKPIRKLYYNLNITFISVIIAIFIGGIEGIQVISNQTNNNTGIFYLVNKVQFDSFGYIIIGLFLVSWLVSFLYYKIKRYDLLTSHKK